MSRATKILLIALILSLPLWWGVNIFQRNLENFMVAQISEPLQNIVLIEIPKKPEKPKLELQAAAAMSVKINENRQPKILFQENINKPLAIASLTKLMTALIVLRDPQNYDFESTEILISNKAANQENVPNYGNLKSGEQFNIESLLSLMLFYSSNDAASALSEVIGAENFVEKMNLKTKDLGLQNTHFVNPTGLDPENENLHYDAENSEFYNYSTTQDLAILAENILKEYPLIFDISIKEGSYPFKNGVSNLVIPENQKIIGSKTGYTDEAGGCMILILSDAKNNFFINIILGALSAEDRVIEMQKLVDWLNI